MPDGNSSDVGREIGVGSSVNGEVIVLVKGSSDSIRDIHDVLCFRVSMGQDSAYTTRVVMVRALVLCYVLAGMQVHST